ncbi:hypothetical protein [Propionivibrio sp.]|uniref:hypothetical protein n=1 Tax=Propionivibrio sp. TaxID=2212460 RepID=UPI003BF1BB66
MRDMESRNAQSRQSLRLAVAISLLLHSAVLFLGFSSSDPTSGPATNPDNSTKANHPRLLAAIVAPAKPLLRVPPSSHEEAAPKSEAKKQVASSGKQVEKRKLSAPTGVWAARSWSSAERADMDKFLNELAAQAKPPTGRELSKRALAMARQMGRNPQGNGDDEALVQPTATGKMIEPFSLEMYFDAFVRKLNRSAAFVKNDPRVRGSRKALVQITLNSDGSLKGYRVVRSGDQEAEIAYIKSVLDRASPFAAFPPDIRNVSDSLLILMCIYPAHAGGGSGFSRIFGAQECKD